MHNIAYCHWFNLFAPKQACSNGEDGERSGSLSEYNFTSIPFKEMIYV